MEVEVKLLEVEENATRLLTLANKTPYATRAKENKMLIQTALTYAVDAIAIIGISGIIVHAFYTSHCQWMAANCPPVKPFQLPEVKPEVKPKVRVESQPEVKLEVRVEPQPEVKLEAKEATEVIPTTEAVDEVMKPRKICSKKMPQPKLQPLSVGAAALDYSVLSSEQLRKECVLQGVNWRNGGDYGKPMKKAQMLAVLR